MAVTQLRCDPRARTIYDDARRRGHTKKDAMRVLKRHLSDVIYRRMTRDFKTRQPARSTTLYAPLDIGASDRTGKAEWPHWFSRFQNYRILALLYAGRPNWSLLPPSNKPREI